MTKTKSISIRNFFLTIVALALTSGSALGQEWKPDKGHQVEQPKTYSPFLDEHYPQKVLFGDTHFHSRLSVDCGLIGNKLGL